MNRLPWTHFTAGRSSSVVHVFDVEQCDTCGHDVEGANAVSISRADALRFGLIEVSHRLPEIWPNESTGEYCCDDCIETEGV